MNYVFGCEFQELTQGSRASPAYHGQATFSPWPLSNPRILRFRRQSSFWQPRSFLPDIELFQERIGGRIALVTELNTWPVSTSSVLQPSSRKSPGDDDIRCSQLDECVSDSRRYKPRQPIVLAGDFNFDISRTAICPVLGATNFRNAFANQHSLTTRAKSSLTGVKPSIGSSSAVPSGPPSPKFIARHQAPIIIQYP